MTGKLPSYLPSDMTTALDATYTRGFMLGRAAGLERACELLRAMPLSADTIKLIEVFTNEKYRNDTTPL